MKLMVPASTLKDAEELLKNGADDIYLGMQTDFFSQYSFNGRARNAKSGKNISPSYDEFKKICLQVHLSGGSIYFLANTPFIHGKDALFKNKFLEYIEAGIHAGADYIILSDILAIQWVRHKFPEIKIAASSYMEAQNLLTIKLLEDMGVKQVILSYQSTLDEIKRISEESNLQIEVFGHGGCSFYVGTCNMFHEMGEKLEIGYPCRATYSTYYEDNFLGDERVLDCFKMCSLCKIRELITYNVHSLKIVGRDLQANYILEIVKMYRKAIDLCSNESTEDIKTQVPVWWKKTWCNSEKLCRYGRKKDEHN